MVLGETEKDVNDRIAWIKDHLLRCAVPENIVEARVQDFASGPLTGTPEQCVERLTELGKLGMSYAILNFAEVADDRTALTLFTEKVAPEFTA